MGERIYRGGTPDDGQNEWFNPNRRGKKPDPKTPGTGRAQPFIPGNPNPNMLVGPFSPPPEPPDPLTQFRERFTSKPKPGASPPHPNVSIPGNQSPDPQAWRAERDFRRARVARLQNTPSTKPVIGPPAPTNDGKPQPNRTLIAANPNVVSDVGQNLIQPPTTPSATPQPSPTPQPTPTNSPEPPQAQTPPTPTPTNSPAPPQPQPATETPTPETPAPEPPVVGGQQLLAQAPSAKPGQPSGSLQTGQSVGNWGNLNRPLLVQPRVQRSFRTMEGASAFARSLGQAAAIRREGNQFVIYPLTDDPKFPKGRFSLTRHSLDERTPEQARLRNVPPGITIVTRDGYVRRPGTRGINEYNQGNDSKTISDNLVNIFAGHQEAFGPGLRNIKDKDQFLRQYRLALRDATFNTLAQSELEARQKLQLFAGNTLPPLERTQIRHVSRQLADLDVQIEALQRRINIQESRIAPFGRTSVFGSAPPAQVAAHQQLQQLQAQRQAALSQYPLLSRVNPAEFNQLNEAQQTAKLREATAGVLVDIATTRENIANGKINLMSLPNMVDVTNAGLKLQPEQQRWVAEQIRSDQQREAVTNVAMFALGLGLTITAAALTGPGALPVAKGLGTAIFAANAGISVAQAVNMADQRNVNRAATNTNIDANESIMPQDMNIHMGWVVASFVGAGLDIGEAVVAARLLRQAKDIEPIVRQMSQAHGIPANKLREAYQRAAQGVSNERNIRQVLLSGMDAKTREAMGANLVVQVAKTDAEFFQLTGSRTGNAVTQLIRGADGVIRPKVIVRNGADPSALLEEAIHIRQLSDPAQSQRLARLTEDRLARWGTMSNSDRLLTYRAKIELEIDAQLKLMERYRNSPEALSKAEFQRKMLQQRLAEVQAAQRNPNVRPDWLDPNQPPRLFSKPPKPPTPKGQAPQPQPPVPQKPVNPQAELARFRSKSNLGKDDTLAVVVVDGRSYFGVNSSAQPAEALALRREFLSRIQNELGKLQGKQLNRVRALTHAEAHALMRAYVRSGGKLGKNVTITVDRITCNFCAGENGVTLLRELMGIDRLTIVSPGRTVVLP